MIKLIEDMFGITYLLNVILCESFYQIMIIYNMGEDFFNR